MKAPRAASGLAWVVLAGIAYYVLVVAALHLLEPELDPLTTPISSYVKGRYPALATTTFFAFATLLTALGLGLRRTLPPRRMGRVGVGLIWVGAVGVAIAGIFPGPPMHAVGGAMAFPPLCVAVLILSYKFRRVPRWKDLGWLPAALGLLAVALFLFAITVLSGRGLAGLGQRLFFAALFSWIAVVAWRIKKLLAAGPTAGSRWS